MPKITRNEDFYSLCAKNGYDAWAVWNSKSYFPEEIRKARKDPAYLTPQDEWQWPPKQPAEPAPTGGKVTAFLRPQPKVIDVYLGFMDEEVNARLKVLLEKECNEPDAKKRRPVLLIERGRVSPGDFVLEWPIDNYPEKARSLTVTQVSSKGEVQRMASVDGMSDSAESPDAILARMLALSMEQDVPAEIASSFRKGDKAKRYVDLLSLLQARRAFWKEVNGKKVQIFPTKVALPTNEAGAAWLTVVRFGVGDDRNAPIVVMRTPEMGLQPSLMGPYVAFLFKAIAAMADQLAVVQADRWRKIANPIGEDRTATLKRTLGWPIRVCQFGAQGSTSPRKEYTPGQVLPVVAALFVGVDINTFIEVKSGGEGVGITKGNRGDDPQERWSGGTPDMATLKKWEAAQTTTGVAGVVILITPSRVFEFYRKKVDEGPLADRIETAETNARKFLYAAGDNPPLVSSATVTEAKGHPMLALEKEATKDAKNLKELIAALGTASLKLFDTDKPAAVTMTSSFFGGEPDKQACNKLGIPSVGMEDAHILRVLQTAGARGADKDSDYPLLMNWRIDRINCDPFQIPHDVEEDFKNYIKAQPVTKADYVEICEWGLTGTLGPKTPPCAHWGFPEFLKDRAHGLFYKFVDRERQRSFVPNPLFVEIATDFVKELKDDPAKAITGSALPDKVKEAIKAKAGEVFAEYRSTSRNAEKGQRLLGELMDLVIAQASFGIPRSTFLKVSIDGPVPNQEVLVEVEGAQGDVRIDNGAKVVPAGSCKVKLKGAGEFVSGPGVVTLGNYKVKVEYTENTRMKTWLRPGKWDSSANKIARSATVEDLEAKGEHFDGAAIDRAFYKSCNLMALQSLAETNLL
ncbi:MAG: hypothetical protein ABR567_19595 [Myxococcales bacterium]